MKIAINNANFATIYDTGSQRLYALDKLKAICAFLIVCIHAPFPGTYGDYFTCVTRIAVPVFFMISGFFYSFTTVKSQIKKVFRLIIMANLGYLILGLTKAVIRHNLSVFVTTVFDIKKLVSFIIMNESPFAAHLWYLGAILYVYVLFYLAEKHGQLKWLLLSFPAFLLFDLALGKYSLVLFHREFPVLLIRNWFFVGIPFFSIGLLIQRNKCLLNQKCRKMVFLICIVFFSFTSVLERWILESYQVNAIRDQYISTSFLAVCVFLYFLCFVNNKQNSLAIIGYRDSMWIYIIHYALMILIRPVMKYLPYINDIYISVRPIIIFILSLAIVELTRKVLANSFTKST